MNDEIKYKCTEIKQDIKISKIYTIHYFEYTKDFFFGGEEHDFWEFIYVDAGVIEVTAAGVQHTLFKGDILFHEPGEFHQLWANGKTAPNLVVMSFECKSPAAKWFSRKILKMKDQERTLLGHIIHESQRNFITPLDDPTTIGLERRENAPFGCENMIKIHLEELLIRLIRRDSDISLPDRITNSIDNRTKESAFNKVVNYMQDNLTNEFSLEDLCNATGYSRSYLHRIFKDKTTRSIMEYYKRIKLEKAKQMIREGSSNISQISDVLNYSSQQYFSKVFKRYIGMTPSEYASSVKLKTDYYAKP
ncbi:MAG: AraC family transcriptional regulator [Spirochaetaceae bacterium]